MDFSNRFSPPTHGGGATPPANCGPISWDPVSCGPASCGPNP